MKKIRSNDFGFFEVLLNLNIAVIAIDVIDQSIVFQNVAAIKLLKTTNYNKMTSLFSIVDTSINKTAPVQKKITIGERILGYTIYPLFERYLWIFFTDITEKERLEKIAEATTHLDNIGYIFSGIAHEIGNPLNSIKTAVTVLNENLDKFPQEKITEYLDGILYEILRMEFLLKSMKTFNAYEGIKVKPLHIRYFLKNFMKLILKDANKRGIDLDIKIKQIDLIAYVDTRALQQIILNLITNAFDAVEKVDNPKIECSVVKNNNRIIIKIKDNGIGVSDEEINKLFLPFYTTKSKGTGLGLAITVNLLTKMDGTIDIESKPGEGTTVIISLKEWNFE